MSETVTESLRLIIESKSDTARADVAKLEQSVKQFKATTEKELAAAQKRVAELEKQVNKTGNAATQDLGKAGKAAKQMGEDTKKGADQASAGLAQAKQKATEAASGMQAAATQAKTSMAGMGTQATQSTTQVVQGFNSANQAVGQFTRDANGRLRDFRGKFVTDTDAINRGLGQTKKSLHDTGGAFQEMGTQATVAAAAMAATIGLTAKTFGDFQAEMNTLQAVSGAAAAEMDAFSAKAFQLGENSKFGTSEIARTGVELAKLGFVSDEVINSLDGIVASASASGVGLVEAGELIAGTLRGFKMDASQAGEVADILAQAANATALSFQDVSYSMKYIAPIAAASSQSLTDMSAVLGILANNMIKGEQAGTSVRSMMLRLTDPTEEVSGVIEKFKISIEDSEGKLRPLPAIIGQLQEKMGGLTEKTRNQYLAQLFGTEAMSAASALYNTSAEDLQALIDKMENATGAADEMASVMNQGLKYSMDELMSSMENAAIAFGEQMEPQLRAVIESLKEAVDWFGKLPDPIKASVSQAGLASLGIAGLIGVIGGGSWAILNMISLFTKLKDALILAGAPAKVLATTLAGMGLAVIGGLAIGGAVALTMNEMANAANKEADVLDQANARQDALMKSYHKFANWLKDVRAGNEEAAKSVKFTAKELGEAALALEKMGKKDSEDWRLASNMQHGVKNDETTSKAVDEQAAKEAKDRAKKAELAEKEKERLEKEDKAQKERNKDLFDQWDAEAKAFEAAQKEKAGAAAASAAQIADTDGQLAHQLAGSAQQIVREMNSVGRCYEGVHRSFLRAFGKSPFQGQSAWMAADQLARDARFTEQKITDRNQLRNLPAGAVVVWDRSSDPRMRARGKGYEHGHISIADGRGNEMSDHTQRQMTQHYAGGAARIFIPKGSSFSGGTAVDQARINAEIGKYEQLLAKAVARRNELEKAGLKDSDSWDQANKKAESYQNKIRELRGEASQAVADDAERIRKQQEQAFKSLIQQLDQMAEKTGQKIAALEQALEQKGMTELQKTANNFSRDIEAAQDDIFALQIQLASVNLTEEQRAQIVERIRGAQEDINRLLITQGKTLEDQQKDYFKKLMKDLGKEEAAARVEAMADGLEKTLAMIDAEKQARIEANQKVIEEARKNFSTMTPYMQALAAGGQTDAQGNARFDGTAAYAALKAKEQAIKADAVLRSEQAREDDAQRVKQAEFDARRLQIQQDLSARRITETQATQQEYKLQQDITANLERQLLNAKLRASGKVAEVSDTYAVRDAQKAVNDSKLEQEKIELRLRDIVEQRLEQERQVRQEIMGMTAQAMDAQVTQMERMLGLNTQLGRGVGAWVSTLTGAVEKIKGADGGPLDLLGLLGGGKNAQGLGALFSGARAAAQGGGISGIAGAGAAGAAQGVAGAAALGPLAIIPVAMQLKETVDQFGAEISAQITATMVGDLNKLREQAEQFKQQMLQIDREIADAKLESAKSYAQSVFDIEKQQIIRRRETEITEMYDKLEKLKTKSGIFGMQTAEEKQAFRLFFNSMGEQREQIEARTQMELQRLEQRRIDAMIEANLKAFEYIEKARKDAAARAAAATDDPYDDLEVQRANLRTEAFERYNNALTVRAGLLAQMPAVGPDGKYASAADANTATDLARQIRDVMSRAESVLQTDLAAVDPEIEKREKKIKDDLAAKVRGRVQQTAALRAEATKDNPYDDQQVAFDTLMENLNRERDAELATAGLTEADKEKIREYYRQRERNERAKHLDALKDIEKKAAKELADQYIEKLQQQRTLVQENLETEIRRIEDDMRRKEDEIRRIQARIDDEERKLEQKRREADDAQEKFDAEDSAEFNRNLKLLNTDSAAWRGVQEISNPQNVPGLAGVSGETARLGLLKEIDLIERQAGNERRRESIDQQTYLARMMEAKLMRAAAADQELKQADLTRERKIELEEEWSQAYEEYQKLAKEAIEARYASETAAIEKRIQTEQDSLKKVNDQMQVQQNKIDQLQRQADDKFRKIDDSIRTVERSTRDWEGSIDNVSASVDQLMQKWRAAQAAMGGAASAALGNATGGGGSSAPTNAYIPNISQQDPARGFVVQGPSGQWYRSQADMKKAEGLAKGGGIPGRYRGDNFPTLLDGDETAVPLNRWMPDVVLPMIDRSLKPLIQPRASVVNQYVTKHVEFRDSHFASEIDVTRAVKAAMDERFDGMSNEAGFMYGAF